MGDEQKAPDAITTLANGTQIPRTEPAIPLRTSSKVVATGGSAVLVLQVLQGIPWPQPWMMDLVNSPMFASIFTLAVTYVTARYTKSPISPQIL